MSKEPKTPGSFMAAEIAEAPEVFALTASVDHTANLVPLGLQERRAVYTIARGSSDAAANILSYTFMRHLGIPVTSLPPSTFSVYSGVDMRNAVGLLISQSGASDDLVHSAKGIREHGGSVIALTNQPASPVEAVADATLPISAGPEHAVPATKTVIGSIAAGMACLGAWHPSYRELALAGAVAMKTLGEMPNSDDEKLRAALLRAQHVYVIGRGAGFGAAHEVALKLKETCALHAEAYSASEVLHGPLQLVTKPLFVLLLDSGEPETQESLDKAQARFEQAGGEVIRLRPPDAEDLCPAAASAMLLYMVYPVILATALALGHDPDQPSTLSKVTRTT